MRKFWPFCGFWHVQDLKKRQPQVSAILWILARARSPWRWHAQVSTIVDSGTCKILIKTTCASFGHCGFWHLQDLNKGACACFNHCGFWHMQELMFRRMRGAANRFYGTWWSYPFLVSWALGAIAAPPPLLSSPLLLDDKCLLVALNFAQESLVVLQRLVGDLLNRLEKREQKIRYGKDDITNRLFPKSFSNV